MEDNIERQPEREERRKKIYPGEEERNIDTKAHVVENLQGRSSIEQGCF